MFSKDEELKRVSDAYHRLVISEGNYETPGLKETLENAEPIRRSIYLSEFMKSYQANSLFVRYESLSEYWDDKRIIQLLLMNMANAENSFYVYFYAPQSEIENLNNTLDVIYAYEQERVDKIYNQWNDDGYVIKVDDNRTWGNKNYFKIYPDGAGFIVTECDYHIEKFDIKLTDELKQQLNNEIKKKVENILSDKHYLIIDDRCYLKTFKVSYGFKWLGHSHSHDFDYEDYFLQDYPLNIIEKIMKLSCVKEKFINAPKTSNVFEKIPDDSL